MSVPYLKPTHGLPPPLNSNPESLYWPTRHCLSLSCSPFSLTFSYMGLLWLLRALQVGFCLRTLAPIFCLGLSALHSVLPQSHSDLCPKCHLSDRPALTIPSVAPTQYCFPYVTHHIWNVRPISGFLVCCWTLASVGAPSTGQMEALLVLLCYHPAGLHEPVTCYSVRDGIWIYFCLSWLSLRSLSHFFCRNCIMNGSVIWCWSAGPGSGPWVLLLSWSYTAANWNSCSRTTLFFSIGQQGNQKEE